MIRRFLLCLAAFLSALGVVAVPASAAPAIVRVRFDTSAGPIVIAVDTKRAPITAGNFLAYVDEKRFDGRSFYRAARAKSDPSRGLIQGGINNKVRYARNPIPHEPNSRTGIKHENGTVSMARNAPGSAMGDFFITIGAAPQLDASQGYSGYAAFGHVVSGWPAVRRILAAPTFPGGYSRETMGQIIREPFRIVSARRL
jgi:peptidyl-prolyl cis-trans isomerase A (cyclophilin A)